MFKHRKTSRINSVLQQKSVIVLRNWFFWWEKVVKSRSLGRLIRIKKVYRLADERGGITCVTLLESRSCSNRFLEFHFQKGRSSYAFIRSIPNTNYQKYRQLFFTCSLFYMLRLRSVNCLCLKIVPLLGRTMDPLLLVFDKPFVKGIIAFVSDCQLSKFRFLLAPEKCLVQG